MTKSLCHSISLGVTCGAMALSVPEVFDLVVTVSTREDSGWLIEPWYYTGFFRKICLILLVSDVVRQIALRKMFFLRSGVICVLSGAACANWHYWFVPTNVMLMVGVLILVSYCTSIVRDMKAIARDSKETQTPNQSLQPTGASARG